MKEKHWELIKTIVDKALTLSGIERDTYVSTACRNHPNISAEIEELLRSIEESEEARFMKPLREDREELIADLADELTPLADDQHFIGKAIGPYRITEQLGSGGMGIVYKAKRADGEFHHEVAIKLIKHGIDTEEAIRRFRMEREILATLQHPNIAQIYDGGITEDGIPYLIMEFIDGMPVDQYCDERQLTINERLKLFHEVCSAIQFAHANLVVHRDLKAQNIYVTHEGIVKILDFGIAKLLNTKLSEITLLETQPGQKLWTPQYAAPEQVKGEVVTTATDIYALGVLLHKLLTDTYPLDLEDKSVLEVEQIIKTGNPLPPSQSFFNHASKKKYAELRRTPPAELTKKLTGDLDALVLKAIRKEPEYRYASASQLSEDIERYGSGIPLIARKGTLQYRTAKFIRRHKRVLVAATIFLVTAIGFTGFYTWKITEERDRVQLERDKSEQVVEFLTSLFRASDPVEAQGDNLTGLELLERGVKRSEELKDQPVIQAEVLYTIGRTYRGMNRPEEARPLLDKALILQRQYWQKDHPDIAHTLNTLGSVYWSDGATEKAEPYLQEALEMRRRLYGDHHPDVFTSMNNFALLLKDKGELNMAEKLYLETLKNRKEYYGEKHAKIGISLNNLAYFLQERGKLSEAESYYRETVTMWRKLQGEQHSDVAIGLNNLGSVLRKSGQLNEAEEVLQESIGIRQNVYGEEHMKVGYALNNLAMVQKDQKDFTAAERTAKKALAIFYKAHGSKHNNIAVSLSILGEIFKARSNYQKAEEYHQQALDMRRSIFGDEHIQVAYSLGLLGKLNLDHQQPKKAEPLIRQALSIYQNFFPPGDWNIARLQGTLGSCLMAQARYHEAEPFFIEEYKNLKRINGMGAQYVQEATNHLITFYDEWGKPGKAESYRNELVVAEQHEP